MKRTVKITIPKGLGIDNVKYELVDGEIIVSYNTVEECNKRWNEEKKILEDAYVPKFGDIVRVNSHYRGSARDYLICIMPNKSINNYDVSDFFNIANINKGGILSYQCGVLKDNVIIPASESEKQELLNKLAEAGKKWNPETKQLEDIRWIPRIGEIFYYIDVNGEVKAVTHTSFIKFLEDYPNCFKTHEAAQLYANQIKEIFKNSKAE